MRYTKNYKRKLTLEQVTQSLCDPRTLEEQARELGVHKDTLGRARRILMMDEFWHRQRQETFLTTGKEKQSG